MREGYEKYCRNGLCEGESKPKKYYLDEHDYEELKDKCWYSGCQCPGERLIVPKEEQKQSIIDMMKQDEELGLYRETFEQYLQRLKDRRTEDDYKYTDEDFTKYEDYIRDCCKSGMSVYKCLEFMYFAEKEIKLEDVFNDEKKEIVIKVIQEHKNGK